MPSKVYYGSARQGRNIAEETLPAKLDLIIDQLHIRERVKDELVVLKMHTGNNIGYSTIHPVFVRKVVQAVKDGGGEVFVADVEWDTQASYARGYSSEVLGCPIYPTSGPSDKYYYTHSREFKNIKEWRLGGIIQDATFLINFAHAKGHPSCGYGGANKNLALGCMSGETRSAMHDSMHYTPYWFPDKCPDPLVRQQIIAACPFKALTQDRHNPDGIHLHVEQCNQCGRCLKVAPPGSLKIDPANFQVFPEANAVSVSIVLSTFAPGKHTHLCLATHMTPLCDCFGFTSMPILPDAGIFGSDDIVALDQAVLDVTGKSRLIEENLPTAMEVHTREGHPFRWLHGPLKDPYKVTEFGEKYGLGTRDYELVDVLPVQEFAWGGMQYIPAS
jgi:uncharacterized Fe-S center protein